MTITHLGLVQTILTMRHAGYSWAKIRDKIAPDVSKIVIWKIANTSYEPKDPVLRHKLGLSVVKEVILCDKCGRIKSPYHKCKSDPRPSRLSIRLDNPESTARSIKKHMEPEVIAELIGILKDKTE